MTDKSTKLSIVIRAVDQATAKIKAINDRLDRATKPIRDFKEALSDLRSKSGLDDVISGFKGVGSAVAGVLAKLGMIGGVVGVAVAGLFHLVDGFDELGDKAEEAGVSVDFLAQLRYAAERSGASVEQLDAGLKGFSSSLGMARAGTGKMAGFLKLVSPVLLTQLKHTKNNEEAFTLLASAAAKIVDPAKRAAFAQKTLGDASLAPLLGKGAKGIQELRDRYFSLAGSQQEAAASAGEVDDSMKDLHAATDGMKAALVSGLAPALKIIVDRLRDWLQGHRNDIKEWAAWLGERLPGAVASLVKGIQAAVSKVSSFVDAIGGWKTVALGLAAVIVGPLIGAVASFGVALMSTPVGWAIGIAAGVAALIANWDALVDSVREYVSMGPLVERMGALFKEEDPAQTMKNNIIESLTSNDPEMKAFYDGMHGGKDNVTGSNSAFFSAIAAARSQIAGSRTETKVTVDFANAPRGTRVKTDPKGTADVDLSVGYQMGMAP